MAAGLPGAGIGGLFFVLSAYFMLVVEIQRTLRGRSSRERWGLVLRNVAIATAMVVAVTLTIWGMHRLLFPPEDTRHAGKDADGGTNPLLPFSPVLMTLGVLALVLTGALGLRLVAGRKQPGR